MLKILSVFLILNLSILSLANALEQDMKGNFNNQNENFNSDDMDSKMFKEMDTDGNGCVSFEEFKAFSKKRMQNDNNRPPMPPSQNNTNN